MNNQHLSPIESTLKSYVDKEALRVVDILIEKGPHVAVHNIRVSLDVHLSEIPLWRAYFISQIMALMKKYDLESVELSEHLSSQLKQIKL